jgi:translocation and assembly module TamA
VTLVEEAPRRFGFGAEISSVEGLALTGYWFHRNIFGGAERLRFDAEVRGIEGSSGGIDYRLAASFARPGTFSAANTLNLLAEFEVLDEPDFFERLVRVEANIAREISARTKYSFGLGYQFSEVSDDLGDRTFSLISLPLTAEHDRRDAPLNPKAGFYLKAEATPFYDIRSATAGGRILGDARYYRTFGDDGPVTLAGRLQAGSILGAGLAEVPPDMLFFSGGGGTVRGQPYQSLNVPLGGGDFTGGRNLLVVSAEVRVRTGRRLQVVGFADYGFVGAGSLPGSDGASHAGAGLGLRYDTPIGPIRFDVAAPVSGATSSGVQVYVGIGQAF